MNNAKENNLVDPCANRSRIHVARERIRLELYIDMRRS